MRTILAKLSTCVALSLSVISAQAQTVSVSTTPEGVMTFTLPQTATPNKAVTSYLSAPLISDPIYTGAVSAVTSNSITVGDTTPPWSAGQLATAAQPYFVKFLTGSETGRVMLITSNTPSSLSLDTTDHSTQTVALTTAGFSVAVGDSFEVFPGDTLATFFGDTTGTVSQTLTTGAFGTAELVKIFSPTTNRFLYYYFGTSNWVQVGSSTPADNTILYPYSAFIITRAAGHTSPVTFMVTGRVPEVNRLVKLSGSTAAPVYDSTGYPVDMTLSQLQLGSNWATGAFASADKIKVWNSVTSRFDFYYETTPSGTWAKVGDSLNHANDTGILTAGGMVSYNLAGSATGTATFLNSTLPY